MIQVKLSADNVRLLKRATSEPELRGAVDLVLSRIAAAEAGKLFRPEPASKAAHKQFNWRIARDVMREVLGDKLLAPPFPDPIWYQRVNRAMKMNGLTEERLVELAEHARDHMKMPIRLEFLVTQCDRILSGEWDVDKNSTRATSGFKGPVMGGD